MSKPFFKKLISALLLPLCIHTGAGYNYAPTGYTPSQVIAALRPKIKESEYFSRKTPSLLPSARSALGSIIMDLPADLIEGSNPRYMSFEKNDIMTKALFSPANVLLLKKYWDASKDSTTKIQPTVHSLKQVAYMAEVLNNKTLTKFLGQQIADFITSSEKSKKYTPSLTNVLPTKSKVDHAQSLLNALPAKTFPEINKAIIEALYITYPTLMTSAPTKISQQASQIRSLHITPDGQNIVFGTTNDEHQDEVHIFNLTTHEDTTLNNDERATITPDGTKIVTALLNRISILDQQGNKIIKKCDRAAADIHSIMIMPDGTKIVSRNEWMTINIWDIKTGTTTKPLVNKTRIHSLAVTPDKKIIAGGTGRLDIWDIETGVPEKTINSTPEANVTSIIVTPDNKIVFGDFHGKINIITTGPETLLQPFETPFGRFPINAIIQIPKSPYIAFAQEGTLTIMDTETKTFLPVKSRHGTDSQEKITAIVATPDGKNIISGGNKGTINRWDIPQESARDVYEIIRKKQTFFCKPMAIAPQ
ncbi:MAG: hypothetical protein WC707_01165 [Candidatus Babeliaceae bacterium]|jgi:WD40 repeat protein